MGTPSQSLLGLVILIPHQRVKFLTNKGVGCVRSNPRTFYENTMNERRTKQRLVLSESDHTIKMTKKLITWGPGEQINCIYKAMEIEMVVSERSERILPREGSVTKIVRNEQPERERLDMVLTEGTTSSVEPMKIEQVRGQKSATPTKKAEMAESMEQHESVLLAKEKSVEKEKLTAEYAAKTATPTKKKLKRGQSIIVETLDTRG